MERILKKKEKDTTLDNAEIDICSIKPLNKTKESITCYKCKKIGHLSKDCRTNNKSLNSKQSIFCLACGRNGHLILDCHKWKEQMTCTSRTNKTKENSNSKTYCTNCRMINHNTRNCRRKAKTEKQQDTKNVICFNCAETGHFAMNCTKEKNLNV